MNRLSVDAVTDVFYLHYHKEHKDETCNAAVRRAMGHVIEYVLEQKRTQQRETETDNQLSLFEMEIPA